jgi:lipoyl-dependent peroxiredoxin subunit C
MAAILSIESIKRGSIMLTVGKKFPQFSLVATTSNDISNAFETISDDSYQSMWKVYFFWPKDFTFVCPTELAEFARLNEAYLERNTQIIGASIDSEFVHLAWRKENLSLSELPYPMLADIKHELIRNLGIEDENQGVALRATFIVDPENTIRFAMVNDLNVGRNPEEVLRVLDALQTGELCACNWQQGQEPLTIE